MGLNCIGSHSCHQPLQKFLGVFFSAHWKTRKCFFFNRREVHFSCINHVSASRFSVGWSYLKNSGLYFCNSFIMYFAVLVGYDIRGPIRILFLGNKHFWERASSFPSGLQFFTPSYVPEMRLTHNETIWTCIIWLWKQHCGMAFATCFNQEGFSPPSSWRSIFFFLT